MTRSTRPHILVAPATPMLDTLLDIRLTGFPPQRAVTHNLAMRDLIGRTCGAHATFVTDEAGTLAVAHQAPIKGCTPASTPWASSGR